MEVDGRSGQGRADTRTYKLTSVLLYTSHQPLPTPPLPVQLIQTSPSPPSANFVHLPTRPIPHLSSNVHPTSNMAALDNNDASSNAVDGGTFILSALSACLPFSHHALPPADDPDFLSLLPRARLSLFFLSFYFMRATRKMTTHSYSTYAMSAP